MRAVRRRGIGIVSIVAAAAGCSDPSAFQPESPSWRQPGILQLVPTYTITRHDGVADQRDTSVTWSASPGEGVVTAPRVLEVSERVKAGEAFGARVTTIGPSGCWSAERIEVEVDAAARTAELIPFDLHSGAATCTLVLLYLRHDATLALDEPGEWLVRVRGRKARHGDSSWQEPVTAETTVVVEP